MNTKRIQSMPRCVPAVPAGRPCPARSRSRSFLRKCAPRTVIRQGGPPAHDRFFSHPAEVPGDDPDHDGVGDQQARDLLVPRAVFRERGIGRGSQAGRPRGHEGRGVDRGRATARAQGQGAGRGAERQVAVDRCPGDAEHARDLASGHPPSTAAITRRGRPSEEAFMANVSYLAQI